MQGRITMTRPLTLSRRALLAGAAAASAALTMPAGLASARAPMANSQAPAYYRFKIGAFEATVVSDGPLGIGPPSGEAFGGLSKEAMTQTLRDHHLPTDSVSLEQNVLVLNTGERLVLIDTGLGASRMMGPHSGRLVANLKAAGFEPKDFDAIVLTHAHPDHCWALMDESGARVFENAQIYLSQADLDFWTDEAKLSNDMLKAFIAGTRKQLLPNRDRIVFVKDDTEILPGIHAIAAPGHTVGHMVYMISSQGQSLLNAADLAHHHVISLREPQRHFMFDTDGAQGAATRIRMFDMLAAQRTPFIAYHFPWPGIGHVTKEGDGYRYFPAPMQTVL
jgi:glyoxylase-like metal-dependent hydrolase (beta-lactamase superfamily II)